MDERKFNKIDVKKLEHEKVKFYLSTTETFRIKIYKCTKKQLLSDQKLFLCEIQCALVWLLYMYDTCANWKTWRKTKETPVSIQLERESDS